MLRSLVERIDWQLDSSLRDAKACQIKAAPESLDLKFFCAAMVRMDAESLYALYGKAMAQPAVDVAYAALKAHHAVMSINTDYSAGDSPKQTWIDTAMAKMKLKKEVITGADIMDKIPLLGNQNARMFIHPAIKKQKVMCKQTGLVAQYPEVYVKVNGVKLAFQIDTGVQITCITRDAAQRVGIVNYPGAVTQGTALSGSYYFCKDWVNIGKC